jgi:hypothetical protein
MTYSEIIGTEGLQNWRFNRVFEKFLLEEFFCFDNSIIESITEEYKILHGDRSVNYFKEKISHWKKNRASITDLMKSRILELIPRYLSEEKIFHLLKIEVKDQIIQLRKKYRDHPISISELSDVYQFELELISQLKNFSSSSPVYRLHLSEDDKIRFLEILKYLLKQRLKLSYYQVKRDFVSISYLLINIKQNWGQFSYTIDYLNCKVIINNDLGKIVLLPLREPELEDDNYQFQHKSYVNEFLLNDLNKIDYLKTSDNIEKIYSENDFDLTINNFNKLLFHDKEGVIESEFKGYGGLLSVSIIVKSIKKIRQKYWFCVMILFSIYFLSIISTSLLYVFGSINIFTIIFFPILWMYCFGFFINHYKKLIEINSNLKMYSR